VATAANLFSRSLGSAIGAAVFGAIANATLAHSPGALAAATHHVFVGLAVLAVLLVGALLLMPRRSRQLTFD
jgi:hypothetical protein